MDFEMYTDHSFIKGSLGNTQIYDLCEYPFVISSQNKYNPYNKVEIFGLKMNENDGNNINSNEMISFNYYGYSKYCPKFKDNYESIADVKINKVFLVYTQEQFLRFLNYFLTEFLGALATPVVKEEEKELKRVEEMSIINNDDKNDINEENFDEGEEKKFKLILKEKKDEKSENDDKESESKDENQERKESKEISESKESEEKNENDESKEKSEKNQDKENNDNSEIKEEKKEDTNNENKGEVNEEIKDEIMENKKSAKKEEDENEIIEKKEEIEENSSENSKPKKDNIFNLTKSILKLEKKNKEKVKNPREMTFLKLNLNINSPQLILKPRPSFSDYFIAELGLINIQAFYSKVTGKVYKDIEDWRWLTTYQMRLTNCYISRNDGFEILSKTNGVVNMHFTNNTEADLLLPPSEIDTSFQFDLYFNEFSLNLRQKDYILLLMCSDLNIMYTDDKEKMYDYAKYKTQKDLSKINLSKSDINITINSNDISSVTLNNNNKDEKIDLSKYMSMIFTFFVNRVTVNLFMDDKRDLAQLILDEFFLIFKQKMDLSSLMGVYVRNLEVFAYTENNDKEVIASDFSQIINQYEESESDSVDRRCKYANSISNGSSGSKEQSSGDFEEEIIQTLNINNEQKKDSFIYNEIKSLINTNKKKMNERKKRNRKISHYKKKLDDLSGFGYFIVKRIQKCIVIDVSNEEREEGDVVANNINNDEEEEIKDFITKYQFYARLKINTKHDKFIDIKFDGLKFLIRIDKIFLLQAFFVDGLPFYDPDDKDLPNLFDDDEENSPGIKLNVEFKNTLICLLSDSLKNLEQEMYCIQSEIKFYLNKEKVTELKHLIKNEQKVYELAIKKAKNTNKDEKAIKALEKKMQERTSYKMKFTINDISPFICKLEQVLWDESIYIAKRRLTNKFNLSYSNKSKLIYDNSNGKFMEKNKNSMKISKISANLSFKNIMLFSKVMLYYNSLQGEEYKKDYDELLYYTNKKKVYDEKIKQIEEEIKRKANKKNKKQNEIISEIKEEEDEININKNIKINNNENIKINEENKNENKNEIIINTNSTFEEKVEENTDEKFTIIVNDNKDEINEKNHIGYNSDSEEYGEESDDEKKEDNNDKNESPNEEDENKINLENSSEDKNNDLENKKINRDRFRKSKTMIAHYGLDRYIINGFDLILIDNQENSFLPFLSLSCNKIDYSSTTANLFNITNSKLELQFQIMIYNYVSSTWEPFIEGANCVLISFSDSSDKDHIKNRYKLLLHNTNNEDQINNSNNNIKNEQNEKKKSIRDEDKTTLNISISNLTVCILYPIYTRWTESYNELNSSKYKENNGEIQKSEKKEKKMKISNLTLYNYTGRPIFLDNSNNQEELTNEIQNDDDYADWDHIIQFQEMIDDRHSFEIEYKGLISNDMNNQNNNNNDDQINSFNSLSNNYNKKIKISIKECKIKENNEINVDKVSTKKISFKSNLKLSKEISKYSYIISKVALNDKKKSIFLFSPLCFKNKTEFIINIKIECDPFPIIKDIKLGQQEIFPIPFEYIGGYILIKIGDKTTRKIKLIDFMSSNDLLKEIEFQGKYVTLYFSAQEDECHYRIIHIKTYYVIRNLLPFDIMFSVKMSKNMKFSEYMLLPKQSKKNIYYVSCKNDLIVDIKFLDFQTINPVTLFKVSKKEESSYIIKFTDKTRAEMDLLSTVLIKGKITIILHPNSILLNHASDELLFFYGKRKSKEKENKEIPGKIEFRGLTDKKGNIFLLKNDTEKIHLKFNKYISDPFSLDAIETETIIKCNYNIKEENINEKKENENNNQIKIKKPEDLKNKYIEFIMQNKIYLLAKDLDLYCNIIEFVPKYILYNKLKYRLILTCNKNKELLIMQPEQREPFYFFGFGESVELILTIHEKNSDWDYSFPFTLENRNLITLQLNNSIKTKKKFINISFKLYGISNVIIVTEAEINTSRININNYSSNISVRAYQDGFKNNGIFLNPGNEAIFAWPSAKHKKILRFNFFYDISEEENIKMNYKTKYEMLDDELKLKKGKEKERTEK